MRRTSSWANLGLRALVEFGTIAGFAVWGYHSGDSPPAMLALAVLVPTLMFGFWGAVDFRFAGEHAESLRLTQELLISGLAALAFYAADLHGLGWTLAVLTVAHHAAVYVLGERLIKQTA